MKVIELRAILTGLPNDAEVASRPYSSLPYEILDQVAYSHSDNKVTLNFKQQEKKEALNEKDD